MSQTQELELANHAERTTADKRIWTAAEIERAKSRMRDGIVTKLRIENAADLSDAELERCFQFCAGRTQLLRYAKEFRSEGYLTTAHLLAEDTFDRIERSNAAQDAFARKF